MLTNVRILDISRVLAGPVCTMALGDLGADVIKVERVGRGDDTRHWGPPFDEHGESAYFLSVNRNKLSVALEFDRPSDRQLLRSLAEGADVVVENFRRGSLARHGLDPEQILRDQPQLIWCTITGFGPESDRPGYDLVTQAECGWMAVTGEPTGDPMKVGFALSDVLAGKDATISILAALVQRARTGQGQRISISLTASAVAALINVAQNALVAGVEPVRLGNAHPNLVPYQLFRTMDRPLVVAVGTDAQWDACARALGLDALANDPALAVNAGRVAQRTEVVEAMSTRLAERRAADWHVLLSAADVPHGIVRPILDVLSGTAGASALVGMPSAIGGRVRFPPPRLDEHGERIRTLGWGAFSG
jgi:crotonobetainyl-CoA:carnitine CoA-transferase CaiB-like acyl-CoA transferase